LRTLAELLLAVQACIDPVLSGVTGSAYVTVHVPKLAYSGGSERRIRSDLSTRSGSLEQKVVEHQDVDLGHAREGGRVGTGDARDGEFLDEAGNAHEESAQPVAARLRPGSWRPLTARGRYDFLPAPRTATPPGPVHVRSRRSRAPTAAMSRVATRGLFTSDRPGPK
jgi:hypothetical protein